MRPPYDLEWADGIEADFVRLAAVNRQLVPIARQLAFDVANHHAIGKALGKRNVSGDLSGYYRLRFDLPKHRPLRFRLVYSQPVGTDKVKIITVGERDEHSVYREALVRINS